MAQPPKVLVLYGSLRIWTSPSKGGATAADVALMRRVVGASMGVKASGGVRSREDAELMIAHGATRIGASASVAIMQNEEGGGGY